MSVQVKRLPLAAECSERIVHPGAVKAAQDQLPGAGELSGISVFFKALGDPTRLKILYALFEGELCVCDVSAVLGMSVSAVSHQLAVLKQARLVDNRRDGKIIYYSLADEHVRRVLTSMRVHLED
jgi:ArsR family transcriptional regulator, lead/cadmium/zinc/bismuth-responsive transcriptional repressor